MYKYAWASCQMELGLKSERDVMILLTQEKSRDFRTMGRVIIWGILGGKGCKRAAKQALSPFPLGCWEFPEWDTEEEVKQIVC